MGIDWTALRIAAIGNDNQQLLPTNIQIPPLPRGLTEFLRRADDPNASPAQLAAIIETDVALTCELLKHVNSSRFGLKHKASTCQQALTLLGIRSTRLLLVAAGMKLAQAARGSKLINLTSFWNANLERAIFAKEVALLLHADPEVAFAGAMLQDFLLPVLTNELLDRYLSFLQLQSSRPMELAAYEDRTFGWNHALAGACLMRGWGFPDELVCCTLLHHRGLELLCDERLGKTAAAAIAVSSLVPDALGQVPNGLEQLLRLERVWQNFQLGEIAQRVDAQFQEQSGNAKHPFSLLHHYTQLTKRNESQVVISPQMQVETV